MKFLLFLLMITSSQATVYLNSENFDELTEGKKAFVAFKAPWCGHCKKLKPDWDKLADNVEVLVGEVDCTTQQALCQKHGVRGYPTIKYTDGFGWQKYEQARSYDALESFVEENLKETCIDNKDLCSEEELEQLELVLELPESDLKQQEKDFNDEISGIEKTYTEEVKRLQEEYAKLTREKDEGVQEVRKSLSLIKYALSKL